MKDRGKPRVLSERRGKWLLNLFPPLFFSRVRLTHIGPGFRSCTVRVARSLLTRNLNGTIFGGTIFSAADPYYAVLYWQIFARRGERIRVWLKSARVRYLRPAASALTLEFAVSDDELRRAVAELDRCGRFVRTYSVEATDEEGRVCAVIETEIYLRRPREDQKDLSAF